MSSQTDMYENLPPFNGGRINQLGQFETILEQASHKGFINNVPTNTESTFDTKSQKIRLQTIATRLYLLGYLPRKIAPNNIPKKIEQISEAVKVFQTEAGLKPDVWVGDKTWYALDELVSFESDFSENIWFSQGEIIHNKRRAVHRAIQLRLWSLGLARRKPNRNFKELDEKELAYFKKILQIFVINHPLHFGFTYASIKLIFDQELLTISIARRTKGNSHKFLLNLSNGNKYQNQQLAEKFIINVAKIELWLLGLDVVIDGKNDFNIDTNSKLYTALIEYHQNFGQNSLSTAKKLAKTITPSLFKSLTAPVLNKQTVILENDASLMVANQLNTNTKIEEAWSYIRNRGVSLWDGLKRVWSWIKKLGKKVMTFVHGNLYKAFFRYASKAYKIVNKGIANAAASIQNYVKGGFVSNSAIVTYEKDLDTIITLKAKATSADNLLTSKKLVQQSTAFNISCRMIWMVFELLKSTLIGIIGWAKLLYALIKNYSKLKILYEDFKLMSTF